MLLQARDACLPCPLPCMRPTADRRLFACRWHNPIRQPVAASMPPRRETPHTAVRSADPAHKRVVAEAVVEKRNESKQKRKPRPGQQAPQKRAKATAAEGACVSGVQGRADSTRPGDVKRAAKTAGVPAKAPLSKLKSDGKPGRKSSGTSKAAARSAASGGAQRLRASGGSAEATAAARREVVRLTWERVEDVCLEADEFSAQYEDVDADAILAANPRGYDSDIMVELLELRRRLQAALDLPYITSRMEDKISDSLNMLDDMITSDALSDQDELGFRLGCRHDCSHIR